MDIDYKEVIDFSKYKSLVNERGLKICYIAEKTGIDKDRISQTIRNVAFPKTDIIAKLAWILNVPASQVVEFKGIEPDAARKKWFETHVLPYRPEGELKGELTYEPLRLMMNMYLDYLYEQTGKEKTVNDLFDMIEPYRRRNHISGGGNKEIAAMSVEKRYGKGYKSPRDNRQYKAVGLIPTTRTKLKYDRPLNIRAIYDICNFFGCSIDWVMSYK